ncbi:MAG TPA: transposase [Streptomyces sp.]|uniref:transposase n=1 Tax=Streptomyces sp. TaxID=1931 RepID=UPI002BD3BF7E|nr:transposase [Streptomyces sp.]HWU05748.1 transposase [Streptomyces sp.]
MTDAPVQLATLCVLQFLMGMSDRQAAEAVRCRMDFTYAMALEPEDPGFPHSVLADLRQRLAEEGRTHRLLDLPLVRLKEAGLASERTTQRTDFTHVVAAVRDLARLELVTEAVRATLEEVIRTAGYLLAGLVDEERGCRYGRRVRLGRKPTRPKTRTLAAGNDVLRRSERPGRPPAEADRRREGAQAVDAEHAIAPRRRLPDGSRGRIDPSESVMSPSSAPLRDLVERMAGHGPRPARRARDLHAHRDARDLERVPGVRNERAERRRR